MSRKLILASTMAMILVGAEAYALGVGALHTQSALNQPFLAQIELTDVRPDELDAVKVSIASSDAYAKAGLERYYYLTKLQFTPEVSSQGRTLVRVSSREPIREPYMDLLVELVWPQGQLVKQYTLLLDPPSIASRRISGSGSMSGARRSAGAGSPGEGFPLAIGTVGSGAGLWALARTHRPEGATVAQTAMAIYRSNQNAFVRGNIHRLIAGKTLILPSRDELFALDPAAADREYAAAVKGRAVRRSPVTDIAAYADTAHLRIAGSPSASTTMPGGSGAFGARPTVAPAGPSVRTTGPGVEKDVLLALETSESTRQETQILRDRIKELETRLSDIQTLLQARNAELARAQVQPVTAETTPPAQVEAASTLPPSAETASITPANPLPGQPAGVEQLPPPTESMAPAEPGAAPVETPATGFVPLPEPSPIPAESPVGVAPPVARPETKPAIPTPAAPPVAPEPSSSWDSLLLPLAGVAGLTAVGILIFSWVTARRRREEADKYLDTDSLEIDDLNEPPTVPHDDRSSVSLEKSESSSLGQGSDLALQSTTHSKAESDGRASPISMMSSLSNFDAETDEADVLSEADIYLAYGRHSEAEELLSNEMKRAPGRLDIKFKLAEAYAGSRNLTAMADLMRDIEMAGGPQVDPGHWRRLQELFERVRSTPENQSASAVPASPGAALASSRDSRGSSTADNLLVDSMGLGIDDVLSLDLSEDQSLPTDTPAKGIGRDDSSLARDLPSSGDELLLDLGDEAGAAGLEDSSALFPGLDTGRNSEPVGVRTPAREEQAPFRSPFEDLTDHSRGADSELILALEEQNVELVDDLDSIFDTSSPEEDLTLVRDEMLAGRPSGSDQAVPAVPDSIPDSIRPSAEESMSTDLLSSQWQMDSGIWDETATKLDLARAYVEMDDIEAAREILQEVINEGREEQRREARALLEKMA